MVAVERDGRDATTRRRGQFRATGAWQLARAEAGPRL